MSAGGTNTHRAGARLVHGQVVVSQLALQAPHLLDERLVLALILLICGAVLVVSLHFCVHFVDLGLQLRGLLAQLPHVERSVHDLPARSHGARRDADHALARHWPIFNVDFGVEPDAGVHWESMTNKPHTTVSPQPTALAAHQRTRLHTSRGHADAPGATPVPRRPVPKRPVPNRPVPKRADEPGRMPLPGRYPRLPGRMVAAVVVAPLVERPQYRSYKARSSATQHTKPACVNLLVRNLGAIRDFLMIRCWTPDHQTLAAGPPCSLQDQRVIRETLCGARPRMQGSWARHHFACVCPAWMLGARVHIEQDPSAWLTQAQVCIPRPRGQGVTSPHRPVSLQATC